MKKTTWGGRVNCGDGSRVRKAKLIGLESQSSFFFHKHSSLLHYIIFVSVTFVHSKYELKAFSHYLVLAPSNKIIKNPFLINIIIFVLFTSFLSEITLTILEIKKIFFSNILQNLHVILYLKFTNIMMHQ